jgi:predicted nucleic acid-binding Zn ribbon protein
MNLLPAKQCARAGCPNKFTTEEPSFRFCSPACAEIVRQEQEAVSSEREYWSEKLYASQGGKRVRPEL